MRPLFLLLILFLPSLHAADLPPFEIVEGDRILLLGDTLLERENTYGYLETRMHEQFPDRHFTVRNLSWAGDTPHGVSRASFDGPDKGWERLKESIALVKPTVVFLGYGMAASLQEMTDRAQDITLNPDPTRYGSEPYSAARFKKEMGELMDAIQKGSADYADLRRSEKGDAATSENLRQSAKSADKPSVPFVLLTPIRHEDLRATKPGLPDPAPHNTLLEQYAKAIEELAKEKGARFVNLFSFDGTAAMALGGPETETENGIHLNGPSYSMMGHRMGKALAWKERTYPIGTTPHLKQIAALRAAVLKKNELFFHRFRPENATYLFGFRKHEQGQNAKEIPMFDPLIEQAEAEIDRLKKSGPQIAPISADAGKDTPKSSSENLRHSAKSADTRPLPDFTVQDGYQITLWAENPLLEKPTQMNWDAAGRLWVCSSSLYPQIEPGQTANDKILILEDTDGDGKADKSSVFADGLLIPTAVAPDLGFQRRDAETAEGRREEEKAKDSTAPNPSANLRASAPSALRINACYVGQSTELLRFEDTDGDGKADTKRVVFSGFGTEDTHHIIHTLKWGPDGRLYFNQSIYIHTHLETQWGMVRLNSGGIFAYDPRTERVEVYAKGWCNPWGHAWDQWGQSFVTDGAGFQGVSWVIPGAMYFTYENGRRIAPSISPGSYPKFASLELIHSPMFPEDWQDNAITCDFRAHRIVRFAIDDLGIDPQIAEISADGKNANPNSPSENLRQSAKSADKPPMTSGYVTREMPDLVRTNDQSFRPIDVRHGPDGALYVADWSNPVINHGEVDFRDPRRDHHMGRIWRISKKDAPPVKWEPLLGKTNAELLEKLLSKSAWEQEAARRVIVKKDLDEDLLARLREMSDRPRQDSDDRSRLFAAYLLNIVHDSHYDMGGLLRGSKIPQVRAAAARALGDMVPAAVESFRSIRRSNPVSDPMGASEHFTWLATAINDPNPRVRLEVIRSLSRLSHDGSAALVLEAALKAPANDPYYDYSAWLSINDLAKPWTDAIASGAWQADTAERAQQLEWGLKAIDPALAGATLSRLVTENKIPLDGTGPWIELLGQAGGAKELRALLDQLAAGKLSAEAETRALNALAEAARLRNARPDGDLQSALARLLPHAKDAKVAKVDEEQNPLRPLRPLREASSVAAIRLVGLWKIDALSQPLESLVETPDSTEQKRAAVVESLKLLAKKDVISKWTAADRPLDLRRAALVALAQLDINAAIEKAGAVFLDLKDEATALETWRGLVGIKDAADAFAAKLPATLPKPVVTAGLRAAREAGKNGAKLLAALTPLAGITDAEARMPKDFTALAAFTKRDGDPARGELIYRRVALGCTTCHAIGGAGGKVGPDMTSLGASAPLDYIIESVINPAAKVKEGFNAVTLPLKDGTQATGIQARETAQEVFLRDVTGREQPIAKAQITGTTNVGSIMPAGMTDALQDRERLDLFAFLGELGKPGPYDASKGNVARVWKLISGADAARVIGAETLMDTGFAGYTLVDGRFVKELLEATAPFVTNGADTLMAVTQFQSTGKTRLKITGAGTAWLDGKLLALSDDLAPDLSAGIHILAVKLDVKTFPEYLRAESPDARFLGN